MASIYDIDFALQWANLLPPKKRTEEMFAWGTALLSPLQWLRDLFFDIYADGGDSISLYENGTAYIKGDRVRYQNALWEVIETPPAAGYLPTDELYWIKIQDDWRGARERVMYNGQKLILEFILNKWFDTTFNQPVDGNSDIYIEELITDDGSFLIGTLESDTGMIAAQESFQEDMIPASYDALVNDFQVNYPLAVIDPAGTVQQQQYYEQLVALVVKYKMYGTNPTYVGY